MCFFCVFSHLLGFDTSVTGLNFSSLRHLHCAFFNTYPVIFANLFKVSLCVFLSCFTGVLFPHDLTYSALPTESSKRLVNNLLLRRFALVLCHHKMQNENYIIKHKALVLFIRKKIHSNLHRRSKRQHNGWNKSQDKTNDTKVFYPLALTTRRLPLLLL